MNIVELIAHQRNDQTGDPQHDHNARMLKAFDKVAPKPIWKDQIDTLLPLDTPQEEIDQILEGIIWVTATHGKATRTADGIRITASGYWLGPCA